MIACRGTPAKGVLLRQLSRPLVAVSAYTAPQGNRCFLGSHPFAGVPRAFFLPVDKDACLREVFALSTMRTMNTGIKHLVLAVLLVVLVVLAGPMVPQVSETSVLNVGEVLGTFPEDPQLALELPDQSSQLAISSQSEVLFFDLHAQAPYTLRYLTVVVEAKGLTLPEKLSDWKIYRAEEGRVDYSESVGYAEEFQSGLLRLRLFSNSAVGYLAEEEESFALVAPLYKTGEGAPSLRLTFPKFLTEEFGWEFMTGHHLEPWMDLEAEAILKTELVQGLPSESVLRQ